eukprot:UN00455
MATQAGPQTSHQGKHLMATKEFDFRVPSAVPKFTLQDVKDAIPKECFERPALKSLSYFARDIALCTGMIITSLSYNTIALAIASAFTGGDASILAPYYEAQAQQSLLTDSPYAFFYQPFFKALFTANIPLLVYSIVLTLLWVAFFKFQGLFMTGLWVLGHEAGHGGQFDSKIANDVFGIIVHSFLLVPYYAWAISHRRHHSHCGDMELDEVHLPHHINDDLPSAGHGSFHNDTNAKKLAGAAELKEEIDNLLTSFSFFKRFLNTMIFCFLGWWVYLFANISGRRYPKDGPLPNHFLPSSPIFSKEERKLIIISDIALLVYLFLFYKFAAAYGVPTFICLYFIPYMVTNWWLVTITLLQHTHPALPHFSHERWNYIQGALATIDRDYGDFYNWALHNINDSHVAHHMFSYMPHYGAVKATPYIQKAVGDYYIKVDTERPMFGVIKSLLSLWTETHFIAEDDHPALTIAHEVVDEMYRDGDASGFDKSDAKTQKYIDIIKKNEEKAYAKSPHPNGVTNHDKEVYWFRTLFFHEQNNKKD